MCTNFSTLFKMCTSFGSLIKSALKQCNSLCFPDERNLRHSWNENSIFTQAVSTFSCSHISRSLLNFRLRIHSKHLYRSFVTPSISALYALLMNSKGGPFFNTSHSSLGCQTYIHGKSKKQLKGNIVKGNCIYKQT